MHPKRTQHLVDLMNLMNIPVRNNVGKNPEVSIVVPAYNEEANLAELYSELLKVLSVLSVSWELIISDDGSTDGTWDAIVALHKKDKNVRGVRLSRNFGHQYALYAGLAVAAGQAVISMDADLQHPPELIPILVGRWQQGCKIVLTVRLDSDNVPLWKRTTSRLFYRLLSLLSGVRIEEGMADFRLLDRQVVTTLLQCREGGLFLRGLLPWIGYPSCKVEYQPQKRFAGKTKYSLIKMLRFGWNGIVSFSIVPLRVGIVIGMFTSLIAFSGIVYAVYSKFISGTAVPGWASAVSIISFLFGVLFVLLGLMGEYIGRIFIEVRGRPRFVIDELVGIDLGLREDFNSRSSTSIPVKGRSEI
jgi:glycosyltransferase involved in cell wall biosynthesis